MSFHKRILPPSLIALSSKEGKQLFCESLSLGGMESFFPLSEQFITQSEPSFCSLSSLAMVLNALNYDPNRVWKDPWRWVSEEMLHCETQEICGHSSEKIKTYGMDFNEFTSLAKCHNVNIISHRANSDIFYHKDDMEEFEKSVIKCSYDNQGNTFIIANFSRERLGQTGIGHFSPIGGYHIKKQLVLIMDVARFKYPPYWAPLKELWESMAVKDVNTNQSRGYFIVSGRYSST